MKKSEPTFWVRNVPVYGDVILAPMAGYSDVPHRAICRAYGSSMNYTEFIATEDLLGGSKQIWSLLDHTENDRPFVCQIFGNDAQKFLAAAQRVEERVQPDIIDINMGCSTRKVSGRGAGVGMMPQPELIAETFSLLTKHLTVPVTGKIRLGWDDNQNYLEIARILVDNGAALIAMHGRTKEQKYNGRADWDAIAHLKQSVGVPVIGNGDVKTPADIERILAHTGCDVVMIGRAAIGNPWIFARRDREDVSLGDVLTAVRRHAREMARYYGETFGLIQFRKHLKQYAAGFPALERHLPTLLTITTMASLEQQLVKIESEDGEWQTINFQSPVVNL